MKALLLLVLLAGCSSGTVYTVEIQAAVSDCAEHSGLHHMRTFTGEHGYTAYCNDNVVITRRIAK